MSGILIAGFGAIGKTAVSKKYNNVMDLESSSFKYIIDDGLLINDNEVVAGTSAKKAPTKIETIRHALFINEDEKNVIVEAIKKYKPESILILGTSDGMVSKIAQNLELPPISQMLQQKKKCKKLEEFV